MKNKLQRLFDWAFEITIIVKGIDGIFELVGGCLLTFVSSASLNSTIHFLLQHELSRNPNDMVSHFLQNLKPISDDAHSFATIYLLGHGVAKLGLAYAILRKKIRFYPVALVFFAVFFVYELYRCTHSHSVGLRIVTALDALIIVLVWFEYKKLKAEQPENADDNTPETASQDL